MAAQKQDDKAETQNRLTSWGEERIPLRPTSLPKEEEAVVPVGGLSPGTAGRVSANASAAPRYSLILACLAMCSTAAVALAAYFPILTYFFTGTDTLTLIETSRLESGADLWRILLEPLMSGSRFLDVARFYRPVSSLSYSMDYFFWHLEPFGYLLTNLVLHVLVSVLVVICITSITRGDVAVGWISGLIFALHPVLVESVPAIDRRHDIIAAAFALLTLSFFVSSYRRDRTSKAMIAGSLCCCLMAMGAKETALIVPFLIFAYAFLFGRGGSWFHRIGEAFRFSGPYILAAIGFVALRTIAVGGLGGYSRVGSVDPAELEQYVANICYGFFTDLLYPVDFLRGSQSGFGTAWTAVLAAAFAYYLMAHVRQSKNDPSNAENSLDGPLIAFLLVWMLAPLGIYLVTLTFVHRGMYFSVIPFAGLVALILTGCFRRGARAFRARRTCETGASARGGGGLTLLTVLSPVPVLALVVTLVVYSPLVCSFPGWRTSAEISSLVLNRLAEGIPGRDDHCVIDLYRLPDRVLSLQAGVPRAKEVTYLQDYSIESWLRMCRPGSMASVSIRSRSWPREFNGEMNVLLSRLRGRIQAVVVGPYEDDYPPRTLSAHP